jgi:hypothetical protein
LASEANEACSRYTPSHAVHTYCLAAESLQFTNIESQCPMLTLVCLLLGCLLTVACVLGCLLRILLNKHHKFFEFLYKPCYSAKCLGGA